MPAPPTQSSVAIVSGALGGIGQAICARLLEDGWRVVALDSRAPQTPTIDNRLLTCQCDIGDRRIVQQQIAHAMRAFGQIDVLINNAAGVTPTARVCDLAPKDWESTLSVNLTGAWNLASAVINHMQTGGGLIINIASQLGHVAAAGRGAYGVSKAGLIALTRAIAVDYADWGVRSVSVSPGAILTQRLVTRYGSEQAANEALAHKYPLQRLGMAQEVASAVAYLCSPEAAFVNGTDFLIDGGYTAI